MFAKESFIVDDYKEYNKNVNNNDNNYNNYCCDNFNNNKTINRINNNNNNYIDNNLEMVCHQVRQKFFLISQTISTVPSQ